MSAQVLLLRGINVGGHGKLAMADLRAMLGDMGAGQARTYIQSGNVVVEHPVDPDDLAARIEVAHGFRPRVFAFDADDWRARLAQRPFPEDPRGLHLFFDADPVPPDPAPLAALAGPSEQVAVTPGIIWLSAPDGIGRSKLAAGLEKATGRQLTARNWRSVVAITGLLGDL